MTIDDIPQQSSESQPENPIPVRNPCATWAYYFSLFSIACFGPILGIPAIILGIIGYNKGTENDEGRKRSVIAIIIASLTSTIYPTILYILIMISDALAAFDPHM